MSLTMPDWFKAATMEISLDRATVTHTSQTTKMTQMVDLYSWQWRISVQLPPCSIADAGAREALVNRLSGGAETIALHHKYRPVPKGTMRGTPTLNANAAQFANQIQIAGAWDATGSVPGTLKAGDMIGLSGQLLQVSEDAAANGSGVMTVNLVNRLRTSAASGASIVWDKPTAEFYLADGKARSVYSPNMGGGQALEFVERVS